MFKKALLREVPFFIITKGKSYHPGNSGFTWALLLKLWFFDFNSSFR